jgi:hypothetical protein
MELFSKEVQTQPMRMLKDLTTLYMLTYAYNQKQAVKAMISDLKDITKFS